jgi:glycosyltransferase involved in cell wall biosynthesis
MIIAEFIQNEFKNYKIHVGLCGENGKIGRNTIQIQYYKKMFQSKIVINCNPSNWEGDYRLFEALSSNALVFSDIMLTPIVNKFIDKKHLIYYNRNNLEDLKNKILFYLNNNELREQIAEEGNKYALTHHTSRNRINEIISHLTD